MDELLNISDFEEGLELLSEKMSFAPGFDGKEMTPEQKKQALIQFMNFVIMF